MKFDVTYQGAVMRGSGAIYDLHAGGVFAGVATAVDDAAVLHTVALTGYSETSARGNTMYQTTGGQWIYLPDGWEKIGVRSVMQYSQNAAQALVNQIIKNNKQIICNNLLCARYANKLTEDQRAQVRELQLRLQARNDALQAGGLTKGVETSYPAGYAEMSAYLDKLMAGESVGVATWVVVVIAATVIAATATAAYFAYKYYAEESERDVKFSKDLTRVLTSKLTEEEYQQLLEETKGIVTKARIRQSLSSYGIVLRIAAFVAAGYFGYTLIKKNLRK